MKHTIIVAASASTPASMQYISRRTRAATMGEFFMDSGEDALIIYDDLSKQAVAYRQISLLLRRPPGREAYPGRRVLSALPPARALARASTRSTSRRRPSGTRQGQDRFADRPADHRDAGGRRHRVRADQRHLDHRRPDLPRDRPVQRRHPSRHERRHLGVARRRRGADRHHQALGGGIRLALAQYRELAAFSQFASDLDEATRKQLERGQRVTELMKQKQYAPMSVAEMALSIYAVNNGYFDKVELQEGRRRSKRRCRRSPSPTTRQQLDAINAEPGASRSTRRR